MDLQPEKTTFSCITKAVEQIDPPRRRILVAMVSAVNQLAHQSPNGKSFPEEIVEIAITFGPLLFMGNKALSLLAHRIFKAIVQHYQVILRPFLHQTSVEHNMVS